MSWIVLAVLAAICVSAATIAEKQLFKKERVLEFLVSFGFFNALLLWVILGLPLSFTIPTQAIWWGVGAGLMGACMLYASEKVIKHFEISVASPVLAISALGTVLLAVLFLGETLGSWQFVGIGLVFLGVFGLEMLHHGPQKPISNKRMWQKIVWLVAAVAFAAIGGVIDKYILSNFTVSPNEYLLLVSAVQAISFFIIGVYMRRKLINPFFALQQNPYLVSIIVVATVLQRYFYINALSLGPLSLVIIIKRSSILWTTLIGGRFFHDHKLFRRMACTIVLCVGLIFLIL